MPPLRERSGDVELLAYHFLDKHAAPTARTIQSISEPAMELLEAYDFPGNVRELENVIASAVVLEQSPVLGLSLAPPAPPEGGRAPRGAACPARCGKTLPTWSHEHIRAVLSTPAATAAPPRASWASLASGLIAKLKRLGIDVEHAGAAARVPPRPGDGER